MERYSILAFLLGAVVNFALLVATAKLYGRPVVMWRLLLGTATFGVYLFVCLQAWVPYLTCLLLRLILLILTGMISFGKEIKQIILYIMISFGMEVIAIGLGNREIYKVLCSGLIFLGIWIAPFLRERSIRYVPVELDYNGKCLRLTALYDTGNMLRDPVSGIPVLILNSKISEQMTGLSQAQLERPLEVMQKPPIEGLRLIPYRTIGQSKGLILGLRMVSVKIGSRRGNSIVAFAPDDFGEESGFQALTGGAI